MAYALVLNATYEPIGVVPGRRALLLVLAAKATAVEDGDALLHSATAALPVPVVVRLTRFVKIPYRTVDPLTRRGVFLRDGGRCVYCEAPATSLDHVVPRSLVICSGYRVAHHLHDWPSRPLVMRRYSGLPHHIPRRLSPSPRTRRVSPVTGWWQWR